MGPTLQPTPWPPPHPAQPTLPNLQVVVLPLLFSLQVEPGETAQVLFANSLVHSGSTTDPFSVVVGSVGPPVSLGLHISKDHILYGRWQSRDLKVQKAQ